MSLGLAAVGVGGLLGGLLGSRKQKVSQSSTRQILPRDYSASLLWDTYMNRLLGDAAYPLIQFNAGGYPAQVSVASLLDKLAGVKQVDPTVTLYTKYYAQPLLL
ncbi:MAG TPA: hypothetical protein PL047_08795, partial [Methanothrix sp.]|nr:hypothetical protein [Methanothrix sp.]